MSEVSARPCPNCHHRLIITNSGAYRCIHCQVWHAVETIDPDGTDKRRAKVLESYRREKARNVV